MWGLDPDAPKEPGRPDGRANWAKLCAENGGCPPTHTHLTPGGGKHLLFKWREDKPVKNESGLDDMGINVRGNGGYVIAPPSQRHDGKAYEIAEPLDFFNFAEAPEWLYELILTKPERPAASITQQALAAGAALPVNDNVELAAEVDRLLADAPRRQAMSAAGLAFTARHRGASARAYAALASLLPARAP